MSAHHLGNLDRVTDSERNALRPIGTTARAAAQRTGALLAGQLALPGVLIFRGVQPEDDEIPRIPHVVFAGRKVVLVESVTWPPGSYRTTEDGRVHCDGVYIGQSVAPLLTAVTYWREALPPGHAVSAVVVVHRGGDGGLTLPRNRTREVTWASTDDAVRAVLRQLLGDRRGISPAALLALSGAAARAAGER